MGNAQQNITAKISCFLVKNMAEENMRWGGKKTKDSAVSIMVAVQCVFSN
jgi:hypothetical protein